MSNTKKLYYNGKLVGEVPATGDDDKDREIAIAYLESIGIRREVTPLQAIFGQASAFATVASDIYKHSLVSAPRNGRVIAPFVVNSTFAIELYLKTIGELYGRSLRGHDLLNLYDALPDQARDDMVAEFTHCQFQCGVENVSAFRQIFDDLRGAFVDWRYLHEPSGPRRIEIQQMIFVMEVLHNVCRNDPKIRAGFE